MILKKKTDNSYLLEMLADKMCNGVILTFFVVIFFNIQTGHGLKCYRCSITEPNNTNCLDPFTSTGIETIECNSECAKLDMKLDMNHTEAGVIGGILRGCKGDSKFCQGESELAWSDGSGTQYCYYCLDNLCNSAPATFLVTSLLIIMIPIVTVLFKK